MEAVVFSWNTVYILFYCVAVHNGEGRRGDRPTHWEENDQSDDPGRQRRRYGLRPGM